MQDGAIVIKAELDSSDLDRGLKQTEAKVTNSANNLSKIIKGAGFATLIAGAGKVAVDTAKKINAETEKVMTTLKGASTLYQGVAVNQERLVAGLSSIAVQTGASLETLGQSVYDALSAGIKPTEDMADVLAVVEKSSKLASAGFTDVSTALSATLKVVNAYGLGVESVDRIQGILMQTQNSGITTVNELGQALAQVVPTASSFGVAFEDVGASIAEMTKQGTKTATATTSLNAIISELGKNGTTASKNLAKASQSAGYTATSFQDLLKEGLSLGDILNIMSQYAEENGLSMVDMFSSIEAGKGALQLSGKNLDDYNTILKSMGQSAGIVSEAFEKTVDPSKRLESAWQTLYVTLGQKFKPTADGVRTILADTITKMAGQYSASSTLKDEIAKLETASKDLAEAQKTVGDNMTEANKAMLAQSRLNVLERMSSVSKTFKEASKEVSTLGSSLEINKRNLDYWSGELQKYVKDSGKTFTEFVADVDKKMGDKKWWQKIFPNEDTPIENAVASWHRLSEAVTTDQATYDKAVADMTESINYLGQSVLAGTVSLEEIAGFNSELAISVAEVLPKLEEEAKALNTLASGGKTPTGNGNPIKVVSDLMKEFQGEVDKLTAKYENLNKAKEDNGEEWSTEQDRLEEMTSLYVTYIAKGLDPTDKAMQDLAKDIIALRKELNQQKTDTEDLVETFEKVEKEYKALQEAGELNGKSLYDQDAEVRALTNLYAEFIRKGLKPTDDAMVKLQKRIEELTSGSKTLKKSWKDLGKEMEGTLENSLKSLASGFGSAIENFISDLMTKEERVLEIESEILEQRKKLADYTDDLSDAEEDLEKAQARGNEKEIRDAQKKVNNLRELKSGTEAVIKSKEEEKKATDNGTKAWENMGKSALLALASTLEGIGGQLAGLAVVHALSMDFVGAGIATAGSVTAFATAGVIKGYAGKFARGGMVEGDSYSGDRMLASVNAGELILNVAQQESLARVLEASVALAELSAGGYGGGITVNMAGATIYGLDEPAVGRAIYENIQNLRYEGVI